MYNYVQLLNSGTRQIITASMQERILELLRKNSMHFHKVTAKLNKCHMI